MPTNSSETSPSETNQISVTPTTETMNEETQDISVESDEIQDISADEDFDSSSEAEETPSETPTVIRRRAAPEASALLTDSEKGPLVRLQKVIAATGIASRRKAEELIVAGAVKVNGRKMTELGVRVHPEIDTITINGQPLASPRDHIYMVLYKPLGIISALSDPEGRPHLGELLKMVPQRPVPIGRMDFNSEGILLLSNDGEMVNALQKARNITKTYRIKVKGHFNAKDLEDLRQGVFSSEGVLRFSEIRLSERLKSKSWIELDVIEGSSLDIRELLNRRGFKVDRIVRSRIGHVNIGPLNPGEWQLVRKVEFEALLKSPEHDEKGLAKLVIGYKAGVPLDARTDRRRYQPGAGDGSSRGVMPSRRGQRFEGKSDNREDRPQREERSFEPRKTEGTPEAHRPRFEGSGDKPRFNRGDRPRFEGSGDRPRFNRGDRPRFEGSSDRPRFNRGDRPRFEGSGDKPRFNRGDRPRFEGSGDRPRFNRGDRPRFQKTDRGFSGARRGGPRRDADSAPRKPSFGRGRDFDQNPFLAE